MEKIVRFGVSMEEKLLKIFDNYIKKESYKGRSEAIRDLIRRKIVEEEWKEKKVVAGSIILVYNHHKRELVDKIMDIQHDFHPFIISTQHIHLDKNNCLEIVVIKGKVEIIKNLFNSLSALKGVKYSSISKATTGKKI